MQRASGATRRRLLTAPCVSTDGGRRRRDLFQLRTGAPAVALARASSHSAACAPQHRSLPNTDTKSRNLLYLTYNAMSEGYKRDEYYRHKRENMADGAVSMIKHFQGVAISSKEAEAKQAASA